VLFNTLVIFVKVCPMRQFESRIAQSTRNLVFI
jgi:hypothetical protein